MKKELIFATANAHKLEEVGKVIDHSKFKLVNLKDVGITEDIEETGDTLEANALIKARYVVERTQSNVFSEDTGLEVDVLGGDPGVITARYAGHQKDAHDNMDLLLENLKGKEDRSAQFRAVIALIIDGQEVLFEGIVRGRIAKEKSGKDGFGYDPVFIPEGYDKTFAELPDEIKLNMSHRTRAVNKMVEFLEV
jgi:XTP/dITP diphosphohydrolase